METIEAIVSLERACAGQIDGEACKEIAALLRNGASATLTVADGKDGFEITIRIYGVRA